MTPMLFHVVILDKQNRYVLSWATVKKIVATEENVKSFVDEQNIKLLTEKGIYDLTPYHWEGTAKPIDLNNL